MALIGMLVGAVLASSPEEGGERLRYVHIATNASTSPTNAPHTIPLLWDHGGHPPRQHAWIRARDIDKLRAEGFLVSPADRRQSGLPEGYRGPDEGEALLRELVEHSSRAGVVRAGTSVGGRPIWAFWTGQSPHAAETAVRLLGGIHGDEAMSFELALATAEALVERDGMDPTITALLDTSIVWVLPYANPDGVVAGTRFNANQVDLNRNFDYAWTPGALGSGSAAFSEPETRAVADLTPYGPQPWLSLSLHGGWENIGYPWNFTAASPTDESVFTDLAAQYATLAGGEFEVTQGGDWYLTQGDTNDWSYGRYGGLDFTVELTYQKTPAADEIPEAIERHLDAVIALLTTAPNLSGRVVDEATGLPLAARIQLLDGAEAAATAPFFADGVTGRFERLVSEEATLMRVSAMGYRSLTVPVDTPQVELTAVSVGRSPLPFRIDPDERVASQAWILTRPGGPVQAVTPGQTLSDLHGLWTVTTGGETWTNAILIGREASPDDLLVPGARAWALFGPTRPLRPVPVIDGALDLEGLPDNEVVDLLVLAGGEHLAMGDIWGHRTPDRGGGDLPTACGCNSSGAVGSMSIWLLLFCARRRR